MAWMISRAGFAFFAAAIFAHVLPAKPASAQSDTAAICDRAAAIAANESGVPLDVLRAISLTETGRTRNGATRPWPWTVNMEGDGHWFAAPDEVLRYVRARHAKGARSFDLGCFQINYRWHGDAFRSFEHMLDPVENARYAARFLSDLYREFGDWTRAAGAYHSRTPKFARRYEARFERFRARLAGDEPARAVPVAVAADPPASRAPARPPASFPLLQASGAPRAPGSLVPLAETPHRGRLIEPRG